MYNKIVNPITGRKVNVNGKLGKKILLNYINLLRGGNGKTLSVWQINVLAREYTKYNKAFHSGERLESPQQTINRYSLATKEILDNSPDVVCLQECSNAFFSSDWNELASEIDDQYHKISHNDGGPGVCILVKKEFGTGIYSILVGGTDDVGGTSKKALAVLVQTKSNDYIWICSVHLAYDPAEEKLKAKKLLNLLGDKIPKWNYFPIILTGDFNMEPEELSALNNTLLSDMDRVEINKSTGLSPKFDVEIEIDHVYSTLELDSFNVGDLQTAIYEKNLKSAGPWIAGSDDIQTSSDHAWINIKFKIP